ncbi:MAG: DUF885 family protein [Actinobacteria bacterium]|uniref:Unannotated protein n=1 Tax=freshwater metagenome TaxID=449393 RepID=A0A6J7CC87_9ZZZZ|nr:DUF885 family protein [Actinomycetota bacterium]
MSHRSEIFEISDTFIDSSAALSPMECTYLGNGLNQDKLDDFSIAGANRSAELTRRTLNRLAMVEPIDDIDRVAKTVMIERLESSLALHESQENLVLWNVLTSPPSNIRSIFELMPKESKADFENIAKRLAAVEMAHKQWIETIAEVAKSGKTTAQRQVRGVIEQLEGYANGGYSQMCKNFDADEKYPAIHSAAKDAEKSSAETAAYLRDVYMQIATPVDAVGVDRYAVWARYFTGAQLDLRSTYEWGVADLKAINARMWAIAEQIKPGAKSLREVADVLDNDPKYVIKGQENVVKYLQDFTDNAITLLDGEFFEIDDRIKKCEARLAPEGSASAPYYNPPSEDLSRPGTTWIPMLGKDQVSNWHLVSTWYHEAVPGHHLQIATVTIEKERLTRFQRTAAWISGYGEGWALYAERFMDELGAFNEPGIEMGYLSGQALRAARIVVDIGMHLGYSDFDGNVWNAESSRKLLNEQALLDEDHSRSETDRYLGWPGQAISYKVGERVWMAAREEAKARLGDGFNMKKFHSYALKIGPMGLDPFAAEMKNWNGG